MAGVDIFLQMGFLGKETDLLHSAIPARHILTFPLLLHFYVQHQ